MNVQDPTNVLIILAAVAIVAVAAVAILALISSTPTLKQLFVGVLANPQLVGLTRALILYVLPIAVGAAIAYINSWTDPRLVGLVPILIGGIRFLEGEVDKRLKPDQNAVNPPPVAGGGSTDLKDGG